MASFSARLSGKDANARGALHRKIRGTRAVAILVAARDRLLTQHRASVARLADMPLTVVGAGLIDFAAFHVSHGLGFLVTGITCLVVEHMIADSDQDRS